MSKLSQVLKQKQHLTPQQILEANIMQLNLVSLEKKIIEEIEKNPLLELSDEDDKELSDSENEINDDEFEWSDLVSNPEEYEVNKVSKSKSEIIENTYSINQKNLSEDMLDQLEDINISNEETKLAKEVLGNLDERGYLSVEPILIADKMNVDEKVVMLLIDKIKNLEPPGIGSRNLKECILSQLKKYYSNEKLAYQIISTCFEDFANKRYKKLIEKNKCNEEDIFKVVELISVLNPHPATNYCSENAEHINPDLSIEKHEGEWKITVNDNFLPSLKINKNYIKMLSDTNDKEVKSFIKRKADSANWFISAIEQRNKTFKKVMNSIIKHQKLYFESDDRNLTPLILKDVAEDIEMDISTVSRVTKGKYVQMPWGIKELKAFFSEGIKMRDGKIVSNTFIKDLLQSIIDEEDKKNPLNDEDIAKKLNKMGYLVARRTVSKYRESLNISVARLRKNII